MIAGQVEHRWALDSFQTCTAQFVLFLVFIGTELAASVAGRDCATVDAGAGGKGLVLEKAGSAGSNVWSKSYWERMVLFCSMFS